MSQEIPYWFTRMVQVALAIIAIKIALALLVKWLRPEVKRSSI